MRPEEGKRSRNSQEQIPAGLDRSLQQQKTPRPKIRMSCGAQSLGHFYIDDDNMRAAHIFSFGLKVTLPWMRYLVRKLGTKKGLVTFRTGLMVPKYAAHRLADGDIVLVPDVSNAASQPKGTGCMVCI